MLTIGDLVAHQFHYTPEDLSHVMNSCLSDLSTTHGRSLETFQALLNDPEFKKAFITLPENTHLMFPYFSYYTDKTLMEWIQLWQSHQVKTITIDPKDLNGYQRHSYQKPYQRDPKNKKPTQHRSLYLCIDASEVPYDWDSVTDFFTEYLRMQAKKHYMDQSPWEIWQSSSDGQSFQHAFLQGHLTRREVRQYRERLFRQAHEVTLFRLTWTLGLYRLLCPPGGKIMDPCSGWGDRLLAAAIDGHAYQGYDPSSALQPCYQAMIESFHDGVHREVIQSPFEEAHVPENMYDLVFTSPPFFDLESYVDEPSQSIQKYPTYDSWVKHFLSPLVRQSILALKPGGVLALHLADYGTYKLTQDLKRVATELQLYLPFQYQGVMLLKGESQRLWPVWIWRKWN